MCKAHVLCDDAHWRYRQARENALKVHSPLHSVVLDTHPGRSNIYHTRNDANVGLCVSRRAVLDEDGSVQIRRTQTNGTSTFLPETLKQACFPGDLGSARCVQRFDDSLNLQFTLRFALSLRSSSMRKPRDPLLKVVSFYYNKSCMVKSTYVYAYAPPPRGGNSPLGKSS